MQYEKPEWEVIKFERINVVTASESEVKDSEFGDGNSEEDGF